MKQSRLAPLLRPLLMLLTLTSLSTVTQARDRPAPPTDVRAAAVAYNALTSQPRLLVQFRNGASERVGFWIEWTRNGQPMPGDLSGLVQCAWGFADEYHCEAMYWFVKGRYAPGYIHERGAIEGFFMANVDFDTDYCFRFRAVTDEQVISADWSGWGCVHTPGPPLPPTAPTQAQVTFLPGNDGRGQLGDATPPRELLEWSSPGNEYAGSFLAQRYDKSTGRWISTPIPLSRINNQVNYEATFDLPATAVDAESLMPMRICAVNITATKCTDARRPFTATNPRVNATQVPNYVKQGPLRGTESVNAKAGSAAALVAASGGRVLASTPVLVNPAARPSAPAGPPAAPVQIKDTWPHVIYSINAAGQLQWSAQANPAAQFTAPQDLASDWGSFINILPGGNGSLYAITADGVLKWFRHEGYLEGSPRFTGPVDVSTGWNAFSKVFAGGDGVLYGISADGTLVWYRHGDVANAVAPAHWAGPTPVGGGWNSFVQVFSMGGGVIYGETPDGKLLWYRHKGYLTGVKDWEGPKQVGTGWAFKNIMSPGPARIVAVNAAGELVQYQHDGYGDGTFRWQGPTVVGAASWLDATRVFPVMQNSLP